MTNAHITVDANEAAANAAYRTNEVIAIYPITPSSGMGELSDEWSANVKQNIWGTVPLVAEMQSEGGAAGAVHGSLQTGALTTTFTASQGLLLMIPNMYKIAGELTATVFHVAARALSYQAISIYGDHSDVMATRATGFALMPSCSVQEAHDMAVIAQASTLEARIPFLHFFDGFRTSHEVSKITYLTDEQLHAMISDELVIAHRNRGLSPERPFIRGTLQNWDVYFQGRESVNPYYNACPDIVAKTMDRFAAVTGRQYHPFDYFGAPDAERVVVLMGSGAETAAETAQYLAARGEKVGAVAVRLFRPFSVKHLMAALPATVKAIAVLDRTKEAGSMGEPLYLDVVAGVHEGIANGLAPFAAAPKIVAGRYGLASKEFTPAMVKAVFDELGKEKPASHFAVGIEDDVCHNSLPYDATFSILPAETVECMFYGLGADGTVGANKNSIKIIGEDTDNYAQGYFVYDSKKSGSVTISHLRFGPHPIRAPYLIGEGCAQFVACHQFSFLERLDMLKFAKPGGVFLINSLYGPEEVWEKIPVEVQQQILDKNLRFYVIDAYEVARKAGMGSRINTIMQTCFFAISGILPKDEAIKQIKKSIEKTYGKRGEAVVRKNFEAVDETLANLFEVKLPEDTGGAVRMRSGMPAEAPEYVHRVVDRVLAFDGDCLPVSAMSPDGTYPSGTAKWEKRNIALEIPVWEQSICIQCGKCVLVCPHAAIRMKVYDPGLLEGAPASFKSMPAKFTEFPNTLFSLQVAPEDCTGCSLCVSACPAKSKSNAAVKAINMAAQAPLREQERENWDFFLKLPDVDRTKLSLATIKNAQLLEPLFEFSGACSGCGETPYVKLASQLFGDRMIVANATGCSSVYGGSLPTTPWSVNKEGRGPAWSNSLFEDNAEFGLGMRLAAEKKYEFACELVRRVAERIGADLAQALLAADQSSESGIREQRARVAELKRLLQADPAPAARQLFSLADDLVRKSVWIMGGDGWAYDIGYGGLDHVLASGHNVNVLVLDTEVYSNTGGQASKATPRAAVAKFAANGKSLAKKDLGLIAMSYGNIYVARVAMGYSDAQTLRAFLEADAYDGPALIIAYSHCIAHGISMEKGLEQQKLAIQSGAWSLYRYNPALAKEGKNPLTVDSKAPSIPVADYAYNETRYQMLVNRDEQRAEMLMNEAGEDARLRWERLQRMADLEAQLHAQGGE
ncbi:MAG TPA: pyruvate:ferredoxin (flavodoxin) oxidoreductase [Anaerolineaceae bacterium]